MNKNYKFNEERNCYEFCDGKDCDLQDQLKHSDSPHKLCSECIGQFEGVAPDNSELSSTSKIRRARKEEVPHATEFISGVGTSSHRKRTLQSRPDLDAIEAGDV